MEPSVSYTYGGDFGFDTCCYPDGKFSVDFRAGRHVSSFSLSREEMNELRELIGYALNTSDEEIGAQK